MSLRIKFTLTLILLVLAVVCTINAARSTMEMLQSFHLQNAMAKSGDVRTIQTWMTIPYIAHMYHVPATYLYQQLQIANPHTFAHMTLHSLATREKHPVNDLVNQVQNTILAYRHTHHPKLLPTPTAGRYKIGRQT